MTEKQLFSVLVRMLGVLVVLVGLRCVAQDLIAYFWDTYPLSMPWSKEWLYCAIILVVGAILIRWPDCVVHLAWDKLPTIGRPNDEENSN